MSNIALASDGMLVKRPILIGEGFVLIGFNEDEWKKPLYEIATNVIEYYFKRRVAFLPSWL